MNLSTIVDKETAIQIEDKTVLGDIADAVSVATNRLKLASSLLFQTRAVNILELILNHKNVSSIVII
jgi:hypothetical protein